MAEDKKELFRNTTQGHLGVVTVDRRGERHGISVEPGGTVWLSEEEQELTAQAPRKAEHNPFIDQPYAVHDEHGEVTEKGTRPPLVRDDSERPTHPVGFAGPPEGDPPQGSYANGEETGVPQPVGFGGP
jgi:hypothetical protein